MNIPSWRKAFALLMALMLPVSLIAADSQGAMIQATNTALVNGSEIAKTSALFPGDKVTIPANSTATIMLKGSSVLVPNSTTLTFGGDSIALDPQAAISVDTTVGMSARIKDIKISPAGNQPTKYQVARYNGKVFVAAKQGPVLIASASGSHLLAAGSSTSMPDPEPQKPGATPTATAGGGAGGGIPTWVAVLIGVAAAGAAAGAAIATTGTPASNSHP
jgi:hypothetical protein